MASNEVNLNTTNLNNVKLILKKIFDNITTIKRLNIIRYNKSIQNKLNIDINSYKIEYSQIIFEIQIYIPGMKKIRVIRRPKKRDSFDKLNEPGEYPIVGLNSDSDYDEYEIKENDDATKYDFIKIAPKYKNYFHFYFDDDENEKKVTYVYNNENVSKIKVIVNYPVINLNSLFYTCSIVRKIKFIKFRRNNIKNMSYMFHCWNINEIKFDKFNTENVKNMEHMFGGCGELSK